MIILSNIIHVTVTSATNIIGNSSGCNIVDNWSGDLADMGYTHILNALFIRHQKHILSNTKYISKSMFLGSKVFLVGIVRDMQEHFQ